jgi:hypothetical protein
MTPPPRLHVIPAIGCDKAVVLRRGPSGQVASLLWTRSDDSFEMGQWLKGRIYEHRADLSPDGRHMVYLAGNGQRWWTALSRAPFLRATAVWPQDSTWHGGGAFAADGRLWLNGAGGEETLPDGLRAADVRAFPHSTDGFHMGKLHAAMMTLRGWRHREGTAYDTVLDKPAGTGWRLELRVVVNARDRGLISNRFALVEDATGTRTEQSDWEWVEPFAGGLQVAARGALRAVRLSPDGRWVEDRVIREFSDMGFEAIPAPYEGVSAS